MRLHQNYFPLKELGAGLGSYKLKNEVDFANIHKHLINHTSISSFLEIKIKWHTGNSFKFIKEN